MNDSKKVNGLVYIRKCCGTCEFNLGGICAGGSKDAPYTYGDEITDESKLCGNYDISFHDYCKLTPVQQDSYHKYLY